MKKAVILLVIAVTAFATSAIGLDRLALRQVVRACVADFKVTGAPFPCLEVDLSSGEDRGYIVLRPPRLNDLIFTPTRKIVGIEDPLLQSAEAPNYFNAAWRARSFLNGADGRAREHDEIALVANSAAVRTQDQLHIHVGCLKTARPTHARSSGAESPDWQMGADRRRGSPYGVLGNAYKGSRPFGYRAVSARCRSPRRRGHTPKEPDDRSSRRSRRRRRPVPDSCFLRRGNGRVVQRSA